METAADLVRARAGDVRPGLVFEERSWTWDQVVGEAAARAAGMGRRHVGVLLENVPEYVFLLAGAALSGAVVVGLNPTRRGEELARDIRHTDCDVVVTDRPELLAGLDLGAARVAGPDWPAAAARVAGPDWPAAAARTAGSPPTPRPDPAPAPGPGPAPEDLFVLIFTSGSTGHPKAVKVSHGRAARAATGVPFGPDDVLYSAMPLFHGNALFSNLLPALHAGCRVVLRRRFSASAFVDDIRRHGCTYFNTVGRAIAHINATPPGAHDRDHHLRWVLGPETSEADKAAFTARFGVPVFDGYGSSENAVILHPARRSAHPAPLGVAPPGTDIAVVDPGTGRECPPARFDAAGTLLNPAEAIGEIVGRDAAGRFEGYYNDPEAEADRLRRGWYWSGDLAYRDGDGVFYFAGRSGDWLRVDSENFTAAPVERILGRAPGVAGVAVYPVPDVSSGDRVMAAVELSPGATFDPVAFSDFLRAQPDLGPKWVPSYVRVTDLPLTATGKLDKKPLRAEAWHTDDPVWARPAQAMVFIAMTGEDRDRLDRELAANGRSHLLGVTA
jgi:fatty-acyl-CoA synthase